MDSSSSKHDLFQSLKDDDSQHRIEKPNMSILDMDRPAETSKRHDSESNKSSYFDDDNKDSGDDNVDKATAFLASNDKKRKLDKQTRKEIEEEEREKML